MVALTGSCFCREATPGVAEHSCVSHGCLLWRLQIDIWMHARTFHVLILTSFSKQAKVSSEGVHMELLPLPQGPPQLWLLLL